MQELQRMQEEQTGRKRQERLDWMYATPASGSTTNAADLEEYLLGKKRVDKMLIGDEHAKVRCALIQPTAEHANGLLQLGASHKDFIAVQNANTQRDIMSKLREDPLLAIKQQEQAAYQSLMNNPLRLKELKEKSGAVKDKKSKKDKKRKHDRSRSRSRSRSPSRRHRSRSASPRASRHHDRDAGRHRDRDYRDDRHRSRSQSPVRRRHDDMDISPRQRHDTREPRRRSRSSTPERRRRPSPSPRRDHGGNESARSRGPPASTGPAMHPARAAMLANNGPPRTGPSQADRDAERAAKLAAMSSAAQDVAVEREERLTSLMAREKEEQARDAAARARTARHGVGSFLDKERSRALTGSEGNLGERIRRNRGGLVSMD